LSETRGSGAETQESNDPAGPTWHLISSGSHQTKIDQSFLNDKAFSFPDTVMRKSSTPLIFGKKIFVEGFHISM
jgi:hypothetical protein